VRAATACVTRAVLVCGSSSHSRARSTCKQCKHEWCWLCSRPWSGHGGSFYHCNVYQGPAASGSGAAAGAASAAGGGGDANLQKLKREEAERRKLQDEFNRFRFYNERFAHHMMGVRAIGPLRHEARARVAPRADGWWWAGLERRGGWGRGAIVEHLSHLRASPPPRPSSPPPRPSSRWSAIELEPGGRRVVSRPA